MTFKRTDLSICSLALFASSLFTLSSAQALPACRYDDLATPHQAYADWNLTLLDTIYKLPESYAPPELVPTDAAGLSPDYKVRRIVIPDLKALTEAARAAGHPLALQSAYRSYGYQVGTFDYWVQLQGRARALKLSARPGHSEHQLGTTLDFRSENGPPPWEVEDWAKTPAGAWLAENAPRYGFVMSYPKGEEETVCYTYEPWHYRYVGRAVAQAVRESGLTLREWLWARQ